MKKSQYSDSQILAILKQEMDPGSRTGVKKF